MKTKNKPPFRADHVGSLLRPKKLLEARNKFLGEQTPDKNLGPHNSLRLRVIEDECVKEAIKMQENAGLRAVTDGEFRRRSWWLEMVLNWEGFSATRQGRISPFIWKNRMGKQQDFSFLSIPKKIKWRESPVVKALKFVQSNTSKITKVTMPSPSVVHCFAGGDTGILTGYYDEIDEFWEDLIKAYKKEISALIGAGALYIQLDDVSLPFLCDATYEPVFSSWGSNPEAVLTNYAKRINQVLEGAPNKVAFTMHTCRGNREGLWAAEGGYDPVSDVLFNQINVDGYFMEFDTPRAGTFNVLKWVPKEKIVALGIMSSKTPVLEDIEFLKQRIDEAQKFIPLERLSLAPQCGFASSILGNPLTIDQQKAKLERLVEVATGVWGEI